MIDSGIAQASPFRTKLGWACLLSFRAWQNKRWESVEHFSRVQRRWSLWGGILFLLVPGIGILAAIAIPAYQDHAVKQRLGGAYNYANAASSAVGHYIHAR